MALRCARVIGNRKIEARQSAEIATTRRMFGINQIPISWIYEQSTRKAERKLSARVGCEESAATKKHKMHKSLQKLLCLLCFFVAYKPLPVSVGPAVGIRVGVGIVGRNLQHVLH